MLVDFGPSGYFSSEKNYRSSYGIDNRLNRKNILIYSSQGGRCHIQVSYPLSFTNILRRCLYSSENEPIMSIASSYNSYIVENSSPKGTCKLRSSFSII